ncbi:MAG: FliO/MopB family protein [Chlamydiae bacterium]|nr:FliO/MopB family protein [Chlamydiota bacterium]
MFFLDTVFVQNEGGNFTQLAEPLKDAATSLPPSDMGMALVKMLLSLLALVLLLFGTYWFLRRLIQQKLQKGSGSQTIQLLEKRMLSPKTMLYLVQIENKKVLLAESHLEIKRLEGISESDPTQNQD